MTEQQVLDALKRNFSIPTGMEICSAAMKDILGDKLQNRIWIKEHFSRLIEDIQSDAYAKYLSAEKPAAANAFRQVFGELLPKNANPDDLFNVLEDNFWALDKFFLSLTQGRRPRAGKAFEYAIKILFDELQYPYTPQPVINGQPDFLLPSHEHFKNNAMDCIIFTVKRTLRERWRQITTEGLQGFMFFLATIDDSISTNDLEAMKKSRIYLVVPKKIKAANYHEASNVISFEIFFEQHLDPAMVRWRKNGVIK